MKRIGAHVVGAVDHVYYDELKFEGYVNKLLSLDFPEGTKNDEDPSITEAGREIPQGKARETAIHDEILTKLEMLSNHMPIIVDFKLPWSSRGYPSLITSPPQCQLLGLQL